MRESDIENYLKKNIERVGGLCLKFESPGYSGVPDRLCLMGNGKQFFVEVKAPGKKLRPLQQKCKREFEKRKHSVWVVDSKEGVDLLIATWVTGGVIVGN
ncbi:VRR-NUC domain-containing protein [Planococcus sp. X10-3]|uniref:VRR-NUC domain-containing protein n=1 Tax=Planococcus sp. X10-3 TaxID=3061240 RepID=UPI003BAE25E6